MPNLEKSSMSIPATMRSSSVHVSYTSGMSEALFSWLYRTGVVFSWFMYWKTVWYALTAII
jgi:hypothetical protein